MTTAPKTFVISPWKYSGKRRWLEVLGTWQARGTDGGAIEAGGDALAAEIPPTAADVAAPVNPKSGFSGPQAFRSIGLSIVVNAICPYFIYRYLEPKFPSGSLTPLVVSTAFPLFGLMLGLTRRRTVDYIAVISLVEISIGIVVTLVASNVRLALVARALQGTLTGLFFLATIPIGHPIIYYIARQFVATATPEITTGFERAHQLDHGHTFRLLTAVLGIATILISFLNVGLATTVAPPTYLFAAPLVGIGSNVVLIAWTIRYSSRQFRRFRSA
jgi:hypothetical protein